ncbi:MAG: hypothetical protein AABW52_03000, partial [Nanoarchaeota archaeon]
REDAEVNVNDDNKVEIKSGKVKTNVKVGMDVKGDVGIGLGISKDEIIDIDAVGGLKLGLGGNKEKSNEAKAESQTSVNVDDKLEIDSSLETGVTA